MSDVPVIRSLPRPGLTILFILLLLMGFSFVIHALPVFQLNSDSLSLLEDPDVWYNYRQIEVMVLDFPRYNWFDPMTAYPSGKIIDWGPLFPLLSVLACMAAGALHRPEILAVSSWTPVFLGILVIPAIYSIGRSIAGVRTGVIAAVFIAVISGEYFYRSMFGVVDHHIAEVLFSTLFCLFYILALITMKEPGVDIRQPRSLVPLILCSSLAGVSLALGLAVMPTLILFGMIVAIYTVLQYSWNMFHGRNTDHLVVANGIVSACAIAAFLAIGNQSPVYSLATYSMAPVHAFVLLFLGTVLLSLFTHLAKGKPLLFIGLVAFTAIAGGSVVILWDSSSLSTGIGAASSFFGQSYAEFPIVEQKPWSLTQAWGNFNIGIILAGIGLIILVYEFYRKKSPAHLFVLSWSAIVLIATLSHIRFEYYGAIVIAILSAYVLGYAFILDDAGTKEIRQGPGQKTKKKERSRKIASAGKDPGVLSALQGTGTSLVVVCLVLFCGISLVNDYSMAEKAGKNVIPVQWVGTLQWMETSTPNLGIPYYGPYSYQEWQYPPESYAVLSWWDYGHWITFIAQRAPVTNPFQDHVRTAAAFFLAESEEEAEMIADELGARYVITDWKMAGTKFPAMIPWYNSTLAEAYYFITFDIPRQSGTESPEIVLFSQPYYRTMVSRLQNFDGSLCVPGSIMYTEYSNPLHRGWNPVLSVKELTDSIEGRERIARFSATNQPGTQAALMGISPTSPVETVSALRHYRLVYEEAGNDQEDQGGSPHSVKIFEYVQGARVNGEGLIEVTVATNTGRVFVYQQESENGWFILPYPTDMPDSPVHALGPYRLTGSGRTLEVTEHDIREGNIIGM